MAKRRASKWQREQRPLSTQFLAPGGISTGIATKRDGEYHVRFISAAAAQKDYICPGCHGRIPPQTAHIVAWPTGSLFGVEYAAEQRRHWHSHCWRIAA